MAQSSAGTASLRQSSRTKKPSRRAEEMHQAESLEPTITTTTTTKPSTIGKGGQRGGSRKAEKVSTTRQRRAASAESEEVHEEDGGEYTEDEDESEEDNEEEAVHAGKVTTSDVDEEEEEERQGSADRYCLCKKGDDGRPMVFCAECNDWFHFKCVSLTKKVAENLSEYICPPCQKETGKRSKTLDEVNGDDWTDTATKEESESESPPPQRRSSAALKRKSSEEEMPRKRSRSSPQSPNIKRVASTARPNPPEPLRKTSGSQNVITAPTGSTTVMKARSETLRKHAVDQLAGTFETIFAEQEEASDDEQERGRKYAAKFEASLFDLHCETVAKTTIQIAGKLYRDRLRTFIFNLKDKSNISLRQKITSNELSADALAAMDNDALANDDIRKEVERRKKENLEQSILKKEVAPLRKLTHKGEIDIDYEAAHMSRINAERESEKEIKAIREDDESVTASDPKGDTSAVSPIKPAPFGSPTISAPPRRLTSSAQSPTMPFDFGNVWTGEEAKEGDETAQIDEDVAKEEEAIVVNGEDHVEEHADNFIDDFLGMPEDKMEDAEESIKVETDTVDESSIVKWRGVISMPEEGICTGKVRQVAGRVLTDDDWKSLFPSTHSIIEGRLPTNSGAPYLVQSKLALRTELVVMTFEPSWEPEAVSQLVDGIVAPNSDDENSQSFEKLLSYFHRRDRYGVLPPLASARGVLVKDFYITPLPKIGMIPQWMDMMQANEFQRQAAHTRDNDLFLLVAVLFKQGPARPVNEAAFSPPQSAGANLSSILGPGSNTLQDLLKAVGGSSNRSPATPLAAAGYQSPATQASNTLNQAILQHQPSIETLREMPKPQLEEMMLNNPNLVDQLLKTLSAAKATSPSPIARPPGPPPPPPPSMQGQQRPAYQMPPSNGQHFNPYGHQPYSNSYDYNYQGPPQANQQRPYPTYPPVEQQGWRPNNAYPSGPYNQASPPSGYNGGAPQNSHMPPSSNYGPPVRGGYNRGGAPPGGQRRY